MYMILFISYALHGRVPAVSVVVQHTAADRRGDDDVRLYSTTTNTKEFGSLSMQNYCSTVASTMAAYTSLL